MTGRGQRQEARHGRRHGRDTTIDGTIESTIGCLIMDAIFPLYRHGRTESENGDNETEDEQEKRRGERE